MMPRGEDGNDTKYALKIHVPFEKIMYNSVLILDCVLVTFVCSFQGVEPLTEKMVEQFTDIYLHYLDFLQKQKVDYQLEHISQSFVCVSV